MKRKRVQGINFPMLKQETGAILGRYANRLKLIEAILICTSTFLLYVMLDQVYQLVIVPLVDDAVANDSFGVSFVAQIVYLVFRNALTLFFTLPLCTGALHMASRMEAGEEVYLAEVFHPFSGARAYGRALRASWSVFWRVFLLVAVEYLLFVPFILALESPFPILCLPVALLMLGALFLWIRFALGGFFGPYRALQGNGERMRPYAVSVGWHFWIGFAPQILLSFFTVGVLLLADTLPRMLVAYFRVCRKLNETITQSEDLIK